MHFDVITDKKDNGKAIEFAKEWLKNIGEGDSIVTMEECRFAIVRVSPMKLKLKL